MLATLWFAIVFIVLVWLWPLLWRNGVQGKVDCIVDFPRHECDIGEAIPLTVTLVNRSFFPLPFAEVHVNLPDELSMTPTARNPRLAFATYVLMRRRVQIEFTLYGAARGPAVVRDMFVRMHEGFGIRNSHVWDLPIANIAVRPRRSPMKSVDIQTTLQGQRTLDRWLFPDETMFKGVRPYQPGDPARHIHWRASARLDQLLSKQFFSSTDANVLLVLNAQISEPHWANSARLPFEASCSYIMDAALRLEHINAKLMFATNAVIVGHKSSIVFSPMNAAGITSMLAHGQPLAAASLTPLLRHMHRHQQSMPSQCILFSSFETDEQKALLEALRRRGKRIDIIRPGEGSELREGR